MSLQTIIQQPQKLAKGLGWFSVGLGSAELCFARSVAKLIGVSPRMRERKMLRIFGAREIAAGAGILTNPRASRWVWARVVGDALDLVELCVGLARQSASRGRTITATLAVAGVTAADVFLCRQAKQRTWKAYRKTGPHALVQHGVPDCG